MVFPELFGGVFAGYACEDFLSAFGIEMVSFFRTLRGGMGGEEENIPGCSSWNFVRSYTSSSTTM